MLGFSFQLPHKMEWTEVYGTFKSIYNLWRTQANTEGLIYDEGCSLKKLIYCSKCIVHVT